MVKNLLRRVLDKASLGFEELSSALCDIESVILVSSINKHYAKAHEVPPFPLLLQCLRVLGILRILEQSSDLTTGTPLSATWKISFICFFFRCSLTFLLYTLDKQKYI